MPASIILNGEITFETCAVCQEPGIIIKHGRTESGSPAHYTMCPRCGNDIVLVCYDCRWCYAKIGDRVTWVHMSKQGRSISMAQKEGLIIGYTNGGQKLHIKLDSGKKVFIPREWCKFVGSGKNQLTQFVQAVAENSRANQNAAYKQAR